MTPREEERFLSRVRRRRRQPDHEPEEPPQEETKKEAKAADAEYETPVVPYLPVLCPRCGEKPGNTDGVYRKKRRYHTCAHCGLRFQSVEIRPGEDP